MAALILAMLTLASGAPLERHDSSRTIDLVLDVGVASRRPIGGLTPRGGPGVRWWFVEWVGVGAHLDVSTELVGLRPEMSGRTPRIGPASLEAGLGVGAGGARKTIGTLDCTGNGFFAPVECDSESRQGRGPVLFVAAHIGPRLDQGPLHLAVHATTASWGRHGQTGVEFVVGYRPAVR